jgi:hypothetical protein
MLLQLADDLTAENFLALWECATTPVKAAEIDEAAVAKVLKAHRVRPSKTRGALRATRTAEERRIGERAGAEVRAARRDDPALLGVG